MSTRGGELRERLARHLRQRAEMGVGPLVFSGLDRSRVLELVQTREVPAIPSLLPDPVLPIRGSMGGPVGDPVGSPMGRAAPSVEPPPTFPGREGEPGVPRRELPADHEELRSLCLECTRCPLHHGRQQVVFADGIPHADVMVVGEAPGAQEDRTGLPFVGAAGKLLDLILASVGLSRQDSVYICNVLKCRPPGNRDPQPDEIRECAPYLLKQIEVVSPRVILAVGTFSGRLLTGQEDSPLSRLRGQVHSYEGVPLVVTYHPAALLRNRGWTRETWEDLQLLREVLDAA